MKKTLLSLALGLGLSTSASALTPQEAFILGSDFQRVAFEGPDAFIAAEELGMTIDYMRKTVIALNNSFKKTDCTVAYGQAFVQMKEAKKATDKTAQAALVNLDKVRDRFYQQINGSIPECFNLR